MKKLMFLMVMALMPMVFVSCGSDDDDNAQSDKIVGTWLEKAYWKEEDGAFYYPGDYWSNRNGKVHVFTKDGKYYKYDWLNDFKTGNVGESGTYTFDGTSLVVNGGFKRKVTFTEDGNGFEWEQTAILEKY